MQQKEYYAERAKGLFTDGYNCAQAVLCAFDDVTHLPMETAAKIASGFGGGIGRMREVCGAVSGAVMVLDMVGGYDDPKASTEKTSHYARIQEFARRYREETGSIICRELLQGVSTAPGGTPEARTEGYYKKRPCAELVALSAGIVADMLLQNK